MMVQVPEMPIFQAWVTHQINADRLLARNLFTGGFGYKTIVLKGLRNNRRLARS